MAESIKIVIPMAGWGTRMRPHTWSKPKPLMPIAGKTVLDYVLDQFDSIPAAFEKEFVFIVGHQGEQIEKYMQDNHPDVKVDFVLQEEMRGQSHAIYLAREHLTGPMLMAFSDTLIETDLTFLKDESCDGMAWVKPVPDPRRFGVAELGSEGHVARLIEKPQDVNNNLVLVGFYYFRSGEALIEAIEKQMARGTSLKGEYYIVDAINVMLEDDVDFRVKRIETWLDTGIPATTLETNRYLIENRADNSAAFADRPGVVIISPVCIHESVQLESAVIGPYVAIGKDTRITDAVVRNSIIGDETEISGLVCENSLLGNKVYIEEQVSHLNVGDNSRLVK
jgi:glucose-1-phosphate thymidylyltransferase